MAPPLRRGYHLRHYDAVIAEIAIALPLRRGDCSRDCGVAITEVAIALLTRRGHCLRHWDTAITEIATVPAPAAQILLAPLRRNHHGYRDHATPAARILIALSLRKKYCARHCNAAIAEIMIVCAPCGTDTACPITPRPLQRS